MAFSKEEIITLENPYEQFKNGDSLAENIAVLDSLSAKEKNALATKIIATCPESAFKRYGSYIKALNASKHLPKEESFYAVITEAYQVRQRIFALLDPRNPHPHTLLCGEEFNPAPFHRFADLAKQLLKGNESAIAERLTLCAPEAARSQIASNLDFAFPKTELTTRVQIAFTLRRNIDRLLLGEKPEQFFTSRDFDNGTCKMFPNMLRILLKDHTKPIGIKLAAIEPPETQAEIKRHLALLHTELFDDMNPFKLIAEVMAANESVAPKKSPVQSTVPGSFFATLATKQPGRSLMDTKSSSEDSNDQLEEDSDENMSFLYSLFCNTI